MRFKPLDPHIVQSLRSQKRSIVQGLLCVAVSALLTVATIPLTERAIRAISNASPLGVDLSRVVPYEKEMSAALGVSVEQFREAYWKHAPAASDALPPSENLASELGKSPQQVQNAINQMVSTPPQNSRSRQDEALNQLGWICAGVVLLFTIKYWFTRGQAYYLSRAANRLAADLRIQLFQKLQRLPISFFNKRRSGAIQSVLTNDINVYQNAVTMIRDTIEGPFKAIAAFITIFLIQWQLSLVAILFIPVLAWFVQRNGRKMKHDQSRVQDDLAHLGAATQEGLSAVRVVKAFNAEAPTSRSYRERVEQTFRSQMSAAKRFSQLRPMVELVGAASLAVILYLCGHLARAGTLQISQIVALTLALDVINQGARSLSNVNNTYNQVQAASQRIYSEILDEPEEDFNHEGQTLTAPLGTLEFHNVSFSYPDGTSALRNVSFKLDHGSSLALVGPSGAGKSTIADLVLRFYDPTEGKVTYDGVDLRDLQLDWLRQQFGVVPQQTFLFAGTIAENLRLGLDSISEEALLKSVDAAHATALVEREGLDAQVGERGATLSGGEAQRLAIARALARNPRILLLDEATSNLDAQSEKAVQEALDEAMERCTTLYIAHRLSTAARADKIVVLRAGEIVEMGSHPELLAAQGLYAHLYGLYTEGLGDEALG